jgi:ABC-2 type transport system ATP-binding protein
VAKEVVGPVIAVHELTKRYGQLLALDRLTLSVESGQILGFIGPNGAGKTTSLRMLVGLVAPTSGTGEMLGQPLTNPSRYLAHVGALIEGPAFYPGLAGEHNLRVLAAAAGLNNASIPTLLERVGLADRAHDPYKTYSLGMKQRLGIAAALLGDPELLILDEPANGLDPEGMRDMRDLLRALSDEGRTVLISSHLLAELDQICNWLIVIHGGRRLFQGLPQGLVGTERLALRPENENDLARLAQLLDRRQLHPHIEDSHVVLPFADARTRGGEIAEIARAAAAAGITLVEINASHTLLEESYLNLIAGAQ